MQDHCVRPGRPSLITSIHPGTTSNIRSHVHSFRPKTTPISSILCSYGWRKRGVQESTHLGRDVVRQLGEAVEVELGPLLQSHRASRKTMQPLESCTTTASVTLFSSNTSGLTKITRLIGPDKNPSKIELTFFPGWLQITVYQVNAALSRCYNAQNVFQITPKNFLSQL